MDVLGGGGVTGGDERVNGHFDVGVCGRGERGAWAAAFSQASRV